MDSGTKVMVYVQLLHTSQIIWCNSHVLRPILSNSVKYTADLLDNNNNYCPYTEFNEKYPGCLTWLEYHSVIMSIPKTWLINTSERKYVHRFEWLSIDFWQIESVSKIIYADILTNNSNIEKYSQKWPSYSDTAISEELMGLSFRTVYSCTVSSKLSKLSVLFVNFWDYNQ